MASLNSCSTHFLLEVRWGPCLGNAQLSSAHLGHSNGAVLPKTTPEAMYCEELSIEAQSLNKRQNDIVKISQRYFPQQKYDKDKQKSLGTD